MSVSELRASAERPMKLGHGFYALSFSSFRGRDSQGIVRRAKLPHSYYSESTCGQLRAMGFEIEMTDAIKPGHATIYFKEKPSNDDLHKVIAAFSAPKPNATARGRR